MSPIKRIAVLGCLLSGILAFLGNKTIYAEDPASQEAKFRAFLNSGEFAPARQLAKELPPAKRDACLAELAKAQSESGAVNAAIRSAAEIGDDRKRAESFGDLNRPKANPQGGGTQADFDDLIDLITKTIRPGSWDGVGGQGSVQPFPTGVKIDPQGVLQPLLKEDRKNQLAMLRAASVRPATDNKNVRCASALRKISITRLEKQLQVLRAAGQPTPEEMELMAGLQRIQYVFVYPDTGDLVLAGPAGDWVAGPDGKVLSRDGGRPPVRLDDLVVIFRHVLNNPEAQFGCLITPRQEGLARLKAFAQNLPAQLNSKADRQRWCEQLREQLGRQDIEVYGLDPRTRAACVMIEADYRMKLVGMGLEEGVPGVKSYLELIQIPPGGSPPSMSVLRWWFTLNYKAVVADKDRRAFSFEGQGVKVESENERLTAEGKRIHTGESEDLNAQFAHSFTDHFEALAEKYPIYADLRNLCDLALVGTLLREENLPSKIDWHLALFGNPEAYPTALGNPPKEVDSVVNFRVIADTSRNRTHTVVGVSGGVTIRPTSLVKGGSLQVDERGYLAQKCEKAESKDIPEDAWWWD
jgi:hypothetical protein